MNPTIEELTSPTLVPRFRTKAGKIFATHRVTHVHLSCPATKQRRIGLSLEEGLEPLLQLSERPHDHAQALRHRFTSALKRECYIHKFNVARGIRAQFREEVCRLRF